MYNDNYCSRKFTRQNLLKNCLYNLTEQICMLVYKKIKITVSFTLKIQLHYLIKAVSFNYN